MTATSNKRKKLEEFTLADTCTLSMATKIKHSAGSLPIPISELRKWDFFKCVELSIIKSVRLAFVSSSPHCNELLDLPMSGFLVTTDDNVYGFGNNTDGAFGIRPFEELEPGETNKVVSLCGQKIIDVKFGGFDSFFFASLTENGKVYMWGDNTDGQLGLGNKEKTVAPTLLDNLTSMIISQIQCGDKHTMALTKDGDVLAWGCNEIGQLGVGLEVKFSSVFLKVVKLSSIKITSINVGCLSSYALSVDNELFSWGNNDKGQLGFFKKGNVFLPTQVKGIKIKKFACGLNYAVGLSNHGNVYEWGYQHLVDITDSSSSSSDSSAESSDSDSDASEVIAEEVVAALTKKEDFLFNGRQVLVYSVDDVAVMRRDNLIAAKQEFGGKCIVWKYCFNNNKHLKETFKPIKVESTSFIDLFRSTAAHQEMSEPLTSFNAPRDVKTQFEMEFINAAVNKGTTDVVFIVEERELRAHKTLLQISSTYFTTLFNSDLTDPNTNVVDIGQDIRYNVFFALLYYVYTKDVLFPTKPECSDLFDLYYLADCYLLTELCTKCEWELKDMLTIENVVELYKITAPRMQIVRDAAKTFMIRFFHFIKNINTLEPAVFATVNAHKGKIVFKFGE